MKLSATAYVILGMVGRRARSGYEIKAAVDESTRFFWAASYGQIYPELRRLAEAGLIEGTDAPRGGRRRTVYALTAAGREALTAWLSEPPETSELREEGLLKLFFAGAVPAAGATAILTAMGGRRRALSERLRDLETAKPADPDDPYPYMVLRAGIEFNEWFADWCERMAAEITAGEGNAKGKGSGNAGKGDAGGGDAGGGEKSQPGEGRD